LRRLASVQPNVLKFAFTIHVKKLLLNEKLKGFANPFAWCVSILTATGGGWLIAVIKRCKDLAFVENSDAQNLCTSDPQIAANHKRMKIGQKKVLTRQ
jgi:hypothetical protein